MLPIRDYSQAQFLFFTTRLGQVKRTALSEFQSVRSNGKVAIGLDSTDELAWVRVTGGDGEIIMVTERGQGIRFAETDARAMGRQAAGVIGIRLAAGDRVIASEVVRPDHDLLVIGKRGLGKRTPLSQFSRIKRGGKGVTAMKLTERTGEIVQAAIVTGDETVVLLSTAGQMIRIPCSQINRCGRATQGFTLMRMCGAAETIASMTVIEPKSEEDDPFAGITENGKELS
jgi:DNA gyrase subunit A